MDDATRFADLYDEHRGAVLAYCLRRTGRSDAEDAVAETFATAWRRVGDIPLDMTLPWLYGVARRVLSRQHRSRRRLRQLRSKIGSQPVAAMAGPEAEVVQRLEYRLVAEALRRLSADDREVLMLAAWEGLGGAEIGAVVGCSADAAAQRLHRARRRLEAGVKWPVDVRQRRGERT